MTTITPLRNLPTVEVSAPLPDQEQVSATLQRLEELPTVREWYGLSQGALARLCGVSRSAVCRWEGGTRIPSGASGVVLTIIFKDYDLREEEG